MSNMRETILRLTQDATGKITDVKVEQEVAPKLLTVIELKPDTTETYINNLTEGSVVDWGDGEKSVVTAEEAQAKKVTHYYAATSTANRVVTIDGVIERRGYQDKSAAFDVNALVAVRSLGELSGNADCLFYKCSNLTAIPAGLFDHCTAVTSFKGCFTVCRNLMAIPTGLFDHCTAVTNFSYCFAGCLGLTGETPYTMVDGKKIKLWDRSPENGFAKVTNRDRCFTACTKLSDYAKAPYSWTKP